MNFLEAIQSGSLEEIKCFLGHLQEIPAAQLEYPFYKAVITAVTSNREDVVQLLLENNSKVNQSVDTTPLHIAAEVGNINIVKMLLEKGASVTAINQDHDTPLHIATKLGNIPIVNMLLEKEASISVINKAGDTPLHIAYENEKMEVVDLLLSYMEKSSDYLDFKNSQGLTHLDIACIRNNKAVMKRYLTDISHSLKLIKGHPVYEELISQQDEKMKQESIESSAQSTSSSIDAKSSVKVELERSNTNNEDILNKPAVAPVINNSIVSANVEDSSESSDNDDDDDSSKESSSLLCKLRRFASMYNRFDSEYSSYDGETSEFHIACGERHPDVIRRYIREGWNVNARLKDLDWNGYPEDSTPLHCAVEERKPENVKVLLKYGANVMLKDENGATSLHVALYNDDPMEDGETLNLLYAATKDKSLNLIEKNGMSFLHVAASRNDLETVKFYLDKGENVNQQIGKDEYYGVSYFSPLHFAVQYRHLEMVKLLIERGADVNSQSVERPIHLACEFGHQDIIQLLLKKGARAEFKTGSYDKKTALHKLLLHISDLEWAKMLVNSGECKDENEAFNKDFGRKYNLFDSCLKELLDAGCDINAQDKDGNTALHYACSTQFYEMISVQKLLLSNADINLENNDGKTPMEIKKLESYRGLAHDYMKLYHHVQELKALGLEVNPKNEECCKKIMEKKEEWSKNKDWEFNGKLFTDEELAAKEKQRLEEVEKMKKVMLTKRVSLYDFARFDPKSFGVTVKNPKLMAIIKIMNTNNGYPIYWYRIWFQWNRACESFKAKTTYKRKSEGDEDASDGKRSTV